MVLWRHLKSLMPQCALQKAWFMRSILQHADEMENLLTLTFILTHTRTVWALQMCRIARWPLNWFTQHTVRVRAFVCSIWFIIYIYIYEFLLMKSISHGHFSTFFSRNFGIPHSIFLIYLKYLYDLQKLRPQIRFHAVDHYLFEKMIQINTCGWHAIVWMKFKWMWNVHKSYTKFFLL